MNSPRGRRRLFLVGVGEMTLLFLLLLVTAFWSGNRAVLGTAGMAFNAAAILLSVVTVPIVTRLSGGPLMRWLVNDVRAPAFLWRFVLLMLAALLIFVLYKELLDAAASLVSSQNPYAGMQRPIGEADAGTWVVGAGLLLAWPPATFLSILAQAGVLALGISPFRMHA